MTVPSIFVFYRQDLCCTVIEKIRACLRRKQIFVLRRHHLLFQYWFGEEACSEARAFVDAKHIRHYPVTIEEEYDPRYPGAHLAL